VINAKIMISKCLSVNEIAKIIGGTVSGDGERLINKVANIENAEEGDISFVSSKKYTNFIESTRASCIIIGQNVDSQGKTVILVESPYSALPKLLSSLYDTKKSLPTGVSNLAFIGKDAIIEDGASILPFTYIGNRCKIGRGTVVHTGVYIGDDTTVGENSYISPNVSIYHETKIGNNVTIHSGTVVGCDGFGYVQESDKSTKIPQVGNVIIEDDVEIGANVDIDRATIGSTRIGKGSKIDNLVQIAHNVEIGEGCVIISQVGISGSTKLGKRVFLGGQVGVVGHISIGDFSKVAAKSGISKSIPKNSVWGGEIGQPIMKWKRSRAAVKRVPEIQSEIKELKNKIKELEEKFAQLQKS